MNLVDLFFKKENKKPQSKTIVKDGVEYNYVKKKGAKFLRISIKSPDKIRVTVPIRCPYENAFNFVKEKEDWIKDHLKKVDTVKLDENFQTKTKNLIISTGLIQKPVIKKTGKFVQFIYPIGSDFYNIENQETFKKAIKLALQTEAREYLPKRLDELSKKTNLKYNKLALKAHKTRWGSCSFRNNINLNINLMTLNDELIDYVLIHELCHTVEKNHQAPFWNLMEFYLPNSKKLRQELKKKPFIV